jgi:ABC-2 type transport system ATP-binding protein
MLQIEKLTKRFGSTIAVDKLSLVVNDGEIVGMLGPNGAGKTTTIRCIAGLLRPNTGTISIDGHDIEKQPEDAKRLFAYVPEVPVAYDMLTVWEHLRFVAAAYRTEDELNKGEEILKRLDLWEKRGSLAMSLSKGMKQKLICACAYVHKAKTFCLDEPFIGLDPKGARELKDIMLEQRTSGMAVLISTHQLEVAERLCDRVIVINRGSIIAQGSVSELRERMSQNSDASLEDMFLSLTENVEADFAISSCRE